MKRIKSIEAYLVGLTVGDGHLERNAQRIVINTSREEFMRKVNNLFVELRVQTSCFFDKAANEWKIAVRSKELYELFLSEYGVVAGNKTTARMRLKIPEQHVSQFLAGLYDAEGWLDLDKGKYPRIRLKIANQSVADSLFVYLSSMGFDAKRHQNKSSFVVDINKQSHVRRFLKEVALLHPRWLKNR